MTVPWPARRSNQSILKEMSPDYSLERLIMMLQYLGHLMQREDSLEKTLMLGETEGRRSRGGQDGMVGWHRRLGGHEFEQFRKWGAEEPGVLPVGSPRLGHGRRSDSCLPAPCRPPGRPRGPSRGVLPPPHLAHPPRLPGRQLQLL